MPAPAIAFSPISTDRPKLGSSPINVDWIIEGAPMARNAVLSSSADGTACTVMWECTAGKFRWRYGIDETVHILEGSVVIDDGQNGPRRVGPGDVVFFPAGSSAIWEVDSYVRKLAFCRRALPAPVGVLYTALIDTARKMRQAIRKKPMADANSLMQSKRA
jgi:uncharacterized protein